MSAPVPAWLQGRAGDVLAAVGGLALPFAFSPFFLWPLALLSTGCFFAVCLGVSPRRAAARGWLYGLGAFGAGVWWIVSSFQFSQIALPVAVVLTAAFIAFLALYPMAVAAGGAALARRLPPSVALLTALPAAFVAGEWLRGWALSGFTWLQLGYSQVDGPLAGLLPVGGVYAAGLALSLMAGAAVWLLLRPGVRSAASLAGLLLAVFLLARVGELDWTQPAADPLDVALVQGSIPQDQKWLPAMRNVTLQRYVSLTAPHLEADLVVWPETALPGRYQGMLPFIEQVGAQARRAGSTILFGVPEWRGSPPRAYNSVFLAGVDSGRYRKRHLVPFGEFLPLDTLLRPVTRALGIPVADFHAGSDAQPTLTVAGHPLAVFICYEIAFGAEVRRSLPDAALLVTVSNDAWFGDSMGPHQHLQMARARALETGRELVRATNTGISVFADERGRVRARLPQFEPGSLAASVTPRQGVTPYVRFGDAPALAIVLVLIVAAGSLAGRSARG